MRVYETASSIKGAGAGIGIGSNTIRALDEAGISEKLMKIGNVLEKQVFLNERGRKMTELNFSLIDEQFGAKNITIHRGELLRILQQAIPLKSIYLKKHAASLYLMPSFGVPFEFPVYWLIPIGAILYGAGKWVGKK